MTTTRPTEIDGLAQRGTETASFGRGILERVWAEAEAKVAAMDLADVEDGDIVEVDVAIPFSVRLSASDDSNRARLCCICYNIDDCYGDCCPEDSEEW